MWRLMCTVVLALWAGAGWGADVWQGRVQYVVDGDSLWVRPADGGRRVKLRLHGVDAPEICQRGGPQARASLQALVQGQVVWVTVRTRDRWGRAVADVRRSSDGLNLAQHMAASGWAWSDAWGRLAAGPYGAEQRRAQAGGQGVFADAAAESPAAFRRRTGNCPKGALGADVP